MTGQELLLRSKVRGIDPKRLKMNMRAIWFTILLVFIADRDIHPQTAVKKVRMGIQSTNIGFLPFHVAYHKGFYREQGIDLETIFMSTQR